jgi:DNA-directed RNA polymerase subunit RPC12/RpoP
LAYKVIIKCPDPEKIISLLKQSHGADYSRVWRINGRTIGVFSFERSGLVTFAGYVNLITLDYDKTTEKCDVTIIGAGGGIPSLASMAELGVLGKGPVNDLMGLAKQQGWEIQVEEAKIESRGSICPKCGSIYVYPEDKIGKDGSVVCQNCGGKFSIEKRANTP